MSLEFVSSKTFGYFISFDDNSRSFKLEENGEIFSYQNIAGYRLIEEKGSMGKGGIARAFSVGALGDQSLFIATRMCIQILLKEGKSKEQFINLLKTPTKSNNIIYRSLKKSAEEIMNKLESIQPENCERNNLPFGYTEELRTLKKLMDEGVITKEEYTLKKRKILGI